MAYQLWGDVFDAAGTVISQTASSYIIQNTDGTRTEFHGTGFTYGAVFGGSVTSVLRTANSGATVLVNIAAPAQNLGELLAIQAEGLAVFNVFETLTGGLTSTVSSTRVSSTQYDFVQNDGTIVRMFGTGLNVEGTSIADFGTITEARLYAADGITVLNTIPGLSLRVASVVNGNNFPIEWVMMQGGATTTTAASYSILNGSAEFGAFFAPIGGSNTFVNNSADGALLTFGQSNFNVVINMTSGNAGTATRGTATDTFSGMRGSSGFIAGSELHNNTFNGSADDDPVFQGGSAADIFYGNSGSDEFYGEGGSDSAYGGTGDDFLAGGEGNDFLYGGAGDDSLYGDFGNDRIDGGAGVDTIDYYDVSSALYIDLRVATQANTGGDGTDIISGIENILGSAFADVLIGNADANTFYGRIGADSIYTEEGDDFAYGGAGVDYVLGRLGNDTLFGGDDNDTLDGGAGTDALSGEAGDDFILGGDANDIIHGGDAGASVGDTADRWLGGDAGDDTIYGGLGNDRMDGGTGNDSLYGGEARDYVTAGSGNDTLYGGSEVGAGDIWLSGEAGTDTIFGEDGNDVLDGGADNDLLYGGNGLDTLYGGAGNDLIEGGAGTDGLFGGTGLDIFDYNLGAGTDNIYDFTNDVDTLQVDAAYGLTAAQVFAAASIFGNHAYINLGGGNGMILLNWILNGNTIAQLADDILIA